MAQPTYIDQALTNVSNAWFNKDNDFIAPLIFPEVVVKKKTFKVPRYGKENLRLETSTVRTGLSKAKRIDTTRTYDDFGPLQEHALSGVVTKDDYELTDSPFEPESDTVEAINAKMILIDENDIASQLADPAVVTNNVDLSGTPTAQWNDKNNSDPFGDIETGLRLMDSAMVRPNSLIMSWTVWTYLISNPNFLDRIKWSETGVLTQEKFLNLLAPYGIEKLFIGRAKKLTSNEGQPDGSFADVWGKNALLGYVTSSPGRKEINGAYKFRLENGRSVTKEQKLNPVHTELVNTDYYDNVIMNDELFYLIKNVVG